MHSNTKPVLRSRLRATGTCNLINHNVAYCRILKVNRNYSTFAINQNLCFWTILAVGQAATIKKTHSLASFHASYLLQGYSQYSYISKMWMSLLHMAEDWFWSVIPVLSQFWRYFSGIIYLNTLNGIVGILYCIVPTDL